MCVHGGMEDLSVCERVSMCVFVCVCACSCVGLCIIVCMRVIARPPVCVGVCVCVCVLMCKGNDPECDIVGEDIDSLPLSLNIETHIHTHRANIQQTPTTVC